MAKINDPAILATVARNDKDWGVRRAAVHNVADPELLARITIDDSDARVRHAAIDKLNDQDALGKVAIEATDANALRIALERLTDQAALARVAVKSQDAAVRRGARDALTDHALAQIGMWVKPQLTRQVTDQGLLARIAVKALDEDVRHAAVEHVGDQTLLARIATHDRESAVRRAAVDKLADDMRLATIAVNDQDSSVRQAVAGLAFETNTRSLLTSVLEGELDVVREAAAQRLSDPASLEHAAMRVTSRHVLKILLANIGDTAMLNRIAAGAANAPMRLAATRKVGAKSWPQIFGAATTSGASIRMLGDALAAVSLFSDVQPEALTATQQASLNLIRRGDESRIPEMVELLEAYGDKTLAEDYLNCGQPDLNAAADTWAGRHGYSTGPGSGSSRASWGRAR